MGTLQDHRPSLSPSSPWYPLPLQAMTCSPTRPNNRVKKNSFSYLHPDVIKAKFDRGLCKQIYIRSMTLRQNEHKQYIQNFKVNIRQKIEMKAETFITDRDSFSLIWLCEPIDRSPPGSSVHGILQARILKWVAIPFFRESSQPRDQTLVSPGRQILYHLSHQGSPKVSSKEKRKRKLWMCRCVDSLTALAQLFLKLAPISTEACYANKTCRYFWKRRIIDLVIPKSYPIFNLIFLKQALLIIKRMVE